MTTRLTPSIKRIGVILVMILSTLLNLACTYKTTTPEGKLRILLQSGEFSSFEQSINDYALENDLELRDSSKHFASGTTTLLLEYYNSHGENVLNISDLMDRKRITIAFFSSEYSDWKKLYTDLKNRISIDFHNSIQNDDFN